VHFDEQNIETNFHVETLSLHRQNSNNRKVAHELSNVVHERDALVHERDALVHERDALVHERDALVHERNRNAKELAQIYRLRTLIKILPSATARAFLIRLKCSKSI
jgi:hypothetical protein